MGINAKMGLLMTAMILSAMPVVYAESGMMDQGDMRQASWHHGDHEEELAKILGLSDDQVKQLKDLHLKEREATKAAFEQMKINGEALEAELVKPNADMNKINDLESKLKAAGAQMVDDHLTNILAIKKMMTPEQFAGFMALKKEKQLRMHHWGGDFKHSDQFHKDWQASKSVDSNDQ